VDSSSELTPEASVSDGDGIDGLHPVRVQLRYRGPSRGRRRPPFERIRGDKSHPASRGYTCEKALRLDHYQNGRHRLTSPLRRRDDGTFEEIDWDTAISEVAARFAEIATTGAARRSSITAWGQGPPRRAYAGATRAALGSVYRSSALAQEKTGEFWVNGKLLGTHVRAEFDEAEVAVFVGRTRGSRTASPAPGRP